MSSLVFFSLLYFVSIVYCDNILKEKVYDRRQVSQSSWIHVKNKKLCPPQPETQYDALGRRQSGLLVSPEHQGICGSCWAFAGTHTFADQINIDANSMVVEFSPGHLARCSNYSVEGNGCCGGFPNSSILYFQEKGAYSASCFSYTLRNYSIPEERKKNDESRLQYKSEHTIDCPRTCDNGDSPPSPRMLVSFQKINKKNISSVIAALNRGPLYASMRTVAGDSDLMNYACGVYDPNTSKGYAGGHAVELVDYSSPSYSGIPFFVAKNSWGNFGESGYFRIAQTTTLFKALISYIINAEATLTEAEMVSLLPDMDSDCAAEEMDLNQNLVETVIRYGLQEIVGKELITCNGGTITPVLQFHSTINATEQVVEGIIVTVTVNVNVERCEEDSAVVSLVVLQNTNNTFMLLEYSYNPDRAALHSFSWCLLLLPIMAYIVN